MKRNLDLNLAFSIIYENIQQHMKDNIFTLNKPVANVLYIRKFHLASLI